MHTVSHRCRHPLSLRVWQSFHETDCQRCNVIQHQHGAGDFRIVGCWRLSCCPLAGCLSHLSAQRCSNLGWLSYFHTTTSLGRVAPRWSLFLPVSFIIIHWHTWLGGLAQGHPAESWLWCLVINLLVPIVVTKNPRVPLSTPSTSQNHPCDTPGSPGAPARRRSFVVRCGRGSWKPLLHSSVRCAPDRWQYYLYWLNIVFLSVWGRLEAYWESRFCCSLVEGSRPEFCPMGGGRRLRDGSFVYGPGVRCIGRRDRFRSLRANNTESFCRIRRVFPHSDVCGGM